MATKFRETLEFIWESEPDRDGNTLKVWRGPSLKDYPPSIADYDFVFYIETSGQYRFRLADQIRLMNLVLSIVVLPQRKKEKALLFINEARKYLDGQEFLL